MNAITTSHVTRVEPTTRTTLAVFPGTGPEDRPIVAAVKATRTGIIKSTLTHVPLSVELDQVYEVAKKLKPTVAGYRRLNDFLGINIIQPDTVLGDDLRHHPNPHHEYDSRGAIKKVTIKKIGIGRNVLGNFVCYTQTLVLDLHVYLVQDMMAKWKPWSGGDRGGSPAKAWGQLMDANRIPPEVLNDPTKKVLHAAEDTALVVDLNHADVQRIIADHTARWKFVARSADSICERRILDKFAPVGKLQQYKDGKCYVPVVSWGDTERDFEEWRELASRAQSGPITVGGEPVETQVDESAADLDEIDAGMMDAQGSADQAEQVYEPEETVAPGVDVPTRAEPSAPEESGPDPAEVAGLIEQVHNAVARLDYSVAESCVVGVAGCKHVQDAYQLSDAAALRAVLAKLQAAIKAKKGPKAKPTAAERTEMF